MYKYLLLAWSLTAAAQTAVIRGVVVENQTNKPLARATVSLQPIAGTQGSVRQMKANRLGQFDFDKLFAGAYIVRAVRMGFLPMEYGQKRWNSAGTPVPLGDGAGEFVNIRLLRYSAIEGAVVDENDVGLPDHDVVAYRNTRPPEVAAQTTTDDRGVYRLHGLEPGAYYVRTGVKRYDDEIYRPTYAREAEEMDQAHTVEVLAEQDAENIVVRPFAGARLNSLFVTTGGFPPDVPVTLTIASELGRKSLNARSYRYVDLPTGHYDLYAEAPDPNSEGAVIAAYQRVMVNHDMSVSLLAQKGAEMAVLEGPGADVGKLWIRRRDLAGFGTLMQAALTRGQATIPAGRWEALLEPPAGYYVSEFAGAVAAAPGVTPRPEGWNEFVATAYLRFHFRLASGAGTLHGLVKRSGNAAPGVPVYLEDYDPATRTRIGELKTTRTDARGEYYFANLAPGTYRVLGTFEYLAPDTATMDLTQAPTINATAHGDQTADLDLYVIR